FSGIERAGTEGSPFLRRGRAGCSGISLCPTLFEYSREGRLFEHQPFDLATSVEETRPYGEDGRGYDASNFCGREALELVKDEYVTFLVGKLREDTGERAHAFAAIDVLVRERRGGIGP